MQMTHSPEGITITLPWPDARLFGLILALSVGGGRDVMELRDGLLIDLQMCEAEHDPR